MATITFSGATHNQIAVVVAHNGSSVNEYKLFVDGSLKYHETFTATTSHSVTKYVTGLNPSTPYYFTLYYFRNGTQIAEATPKTFSTTAPPPPPVPARITGLSVSVSGYAPNAKVSASWNASSGATSYDWSSSVGQNGAVTTTYKEITVASTGTFTFTVYPRNASGTGTGDSKPFTVLAPPAPGPLTGLSVSVTGSAPNATVKATWNSSSGASQYNWSTTATTVDGITNGAVTTTSKSISVKSAGTFNFTVYPVNNSGTGTGDSKAFTVAIPVPSAPVIPSKIAGGFNVNWGFVNGATHYLLEFKPSVNSAWQSRTITTNTTSLSLAQWGLDYDLRVSCSLNGGSTYGQPSSITRAITNPKTPTLNGYYNSGSSLAVLTLGGMSGSDSRFSIIFVEMKRLSDHSLIEAKSTTVNGGQVQFNVTSSQVKLYYFRAYSRVDSSYQAGSAYSGYSDHISFRRPEPFNWTYAGRTLTPPFPLVYGSTKNQNLGFYATAQEWNSLIARIQEFRIYMYNSEYPFEPKDYAVPDKQPEAAQFNVVRNAIATMNSTGIPARKNPGDNITAADFNALVSCLNAIS